MIKDIKEIKEEFTKYLKDLSSNLSYDYYDFESFDYDYLLNNIDNIDFVIFVNENNEIINFATYEKQDDLTFFYLDNYNEETIKDNLNDLKNNFSHPIIGSIDGYYDNPEKLELFKMNSKSNIIDEKYIFRSTPYCLFKEDINILSNLADEINFPEYKGNLTFEVINYNEFTYGKMCNDSFIATSCKNNSGQSHVAGFYYLGQVCNNDDKLLLAKDGDNVVGCIKYGIYGGRFEPKNIGLCFIDIKLPYRNKHIATKLFEKFSDVLKEENSKFEKPLPLYLTDESEMGEQCHMKDIALNKIKDTVCYFTDHKDYVYVSYLNNEEIGRGTSLRNVLPNYIIEEKSIENVR